MGVEIFTAESVRRGHPDKTADQIADTILTEILLRASHDEKAQLATRVACEIGLYNSRVVVIGGEITTNAKYDPIAIAGDVISSIGYVDEAMGLSHQKFTPFVVRKSQSSDIKMGVDSVDIRNVGAGDQGIMIGYATNETPELIPASLLFSHRLVRRADDLMGTKGFEWLWPDGKAQITLVQDEETYRPIRANSVVVSLQHAPTALREEMYDIVREQIVRHVLGDLVDDKTDIKFNSTGRFVTGGPESDTGFTGRKLVVDAYGPDIPVGGGAYSGKDPTKVDRSGAYLARLVATNVVDASLADRCKVIIAYAIGVPDPTQVTVKTLGTGKLDGERLTGTRLKEFEKTLDEVARELFPVKPGEIITQLGLLNRDYRPVAVYGHYGRPELQLPWEQTTMKNSLYDAVNRAMRKR